MLGFALLAFAVLGWVVLFPIWLGFKFGGLRRRVEALEAELREQNANRLPVDPPTQQSAADVPDIIAPEQAADEAPAQSGVPPLQKISAPQPVKSGPWSDAQPPEPPSPPRNFVITSERASQLSKWVRDNWTILIAAVALGLAGVFFVQYGIENGLLSPRLRVLCAIGLGLALIGGGEVLRRRLGDDHDLIGILPSAFSGAGLVAIFAGILSARQLYDLISSLTAFAGIGVTAIAAIVLGWFYGPFLIAFGIFGATAAPFLVGGESEDPFVLMYYFALIVGVGLAVDALKRTAWVSVVALVAPTIAAWMLWTATSVGAQHLIAYGALISLMAIVLPPFSLQPSHDGATILSSVIARKKKIWPEFPTRLATGGAVSAIGFAFVAAETGEAEFWLAIGFLVLLFGAVAVWLRRAPAIEDIGIYAGLAVLVFVGVAGVLNWPVLRAWTGAVIEPEAAAPITLTVLTGLGILLSAMAAWAMFRGRHWAWGLGAAGMAPALVILLDQTWAPLTHLSPSTWALHGLAVAAVMTAGAVRARAQMPDAPLTMALFAIGAMVMIAFACVILLTKAALTIAFAVLALAAAWLDRRFNLEPLTWFVKLAALACSYRLVIDPGVLWATDAGLLDVLISYVGTVGLLVAAWVMLAARNRRHTQMVVESVAGAALAVGVCVVLFRLLERDGWQDSHWAIALFGLIWLISAVAQLYRARAGFRRLRQVLCAVFGAIGLFFLGVSATVLSPLVPFGDPVAGPPVLDSLLVAYMLPALLFFGVYRYFPELQIWLRRAALALGCAFAAGWVGLEIRRLWRGPDLSQPGVTDPEMYSYTIALIALSVGLLVAALLRRSSNLRKLGLAVAAIAVAKVFLLDVSGLAGLTRVFSFLALGLALAGLAAINRWIVRLHEQDAANATDEPSDEP